MGWPFDHQTLDEQEDLFEEILSWLPPKSLLRFKSVNKTWYHRITFLSKQPRFVLKQVSNAQNHTISATTTLIFRRGRTTPDYQNFDHDLPITVLTLFHGGQPQQPSAPIPPSLAGPLFDLGSVNACHHCNGILCLVDRSGRLLLWNPETRQRRLVPNRITNPNNKVLEQGIGFGCDSSGAEYKIVAMHCEFQERSGLKPAKWVPGAEVFSLSTDSWRTVRSKVGQDRQMPDNMHWNLDEGVFIDGFCYWLVRGLGPQRVLCFDVSREAFRSLELPPLSPEYLPAGGGFKLQWRVSAWRGWLAVLSSYEEDGFRGRSSVEAWVMYGGGLWWRCLSAGPFPASRFPLTFLDGDEVLMVDGDKVLWVYDIRTNLERRLCIDRDDCMTYWGLYVETVASVF